MRRNLYKRRYGNTLQTGHERLFGRAKNKSFCLVAQEESIQDRATIAPVVFRWKYKMDEIVIGLIT